MLDNVHYTAELHWAAKAAQGRVDAINKNTNLLWQVVVICDGVERLINYAHSPSYAQVCRDARAGGSAAVHVRSVRVVRVRQRRLVLFPWMKVRRTA